MQTNSYDCGLHDIASATEIFHDRSPCKCLWDSSKLRDHLIKSLQNQVMTRFPIVRECRLLFGGAIKVNEEEEQIYCLCQMPYDKNCDMRQCSLCSAWYYSSCVNITDVCELKTKKWLCAKCNTLHGLLSSQFELFHEFSKRILFI